jgi:hypothetical protein
MIYTKLAIIKTREHSFKHIPNGNEAMAFYISNGHYSMEDGFLTLVAFDNKDRPKVAWSTVTFQEGVDGTVESFTSFDDLDNRLVEAGYPLAR